MKCNRQEVLQNLRIVAMSEYIPTKTIHEEACSDPYEEDWADSDYTEEVPDFVECSINIELKSAYKTITHSAAAELCCRLIEEVSERLCIDTDEATMLLQRHRWCKDTVSELLVSDPEMCMSNVGIVTASCLRDSGNSCGICFESKCEQDMLQLLCGHFYCRDCFVSYLQSRLTGAPFTALFTQCPAEGCSLTIPPSSFLSGDVKTTYQSILIDHFITVSAEFRYCPAAKCEFLYMGTDVTDIVCSCSYAFCLRCGEEAHSPLTCPELDTWKAQYARASTEMSPGAKCPLQGIRRCPGCKIPIEKTGGCDHMSCLRCGLDFNWSSQPTSYSSDFAELAPLLIAQYKECEDKLNSVRDLCEGIDDSPSNPSCAHWESRSMLKEASLHLMTSYVVLKYTTVLLNVFMSAAPMLAHDKVTYQHDVLTQHAQCMHQLLERGINTLVNDGRDDISRGDIASQRIAMEKVKLNLSAEIFELRLNT